MGRPQQPLTDGPPALLTLASWLREQRGQARLTYRALAKTAGFDATTLLRCDSGKAVPRWPVVLAYAEACGASTEQAKELWKRARYEQSKAARDYRAQAAPRPDMVRDIADLSAALVDLYEKAGSPPLRVMEQRGGGFGLLSRSTAGRILHKQAVPYEEPQFTAFLIACEAPAEEHPSWIAAWKRAVRHESDAPPLGQKRVSARWLEGMPPLAVAVLEVLHRGRGCCTTETAERARVSVATARKQLKWLREDGLVETFPRGRAKFHSLTKMGVTARELLGYDPTRTHQASRITVSGGLRAQRGFDVPDSGGRGAAGPQLGSAAAPTWEHMYEGKPRTIVGLPESLSYPVAMLTFYRQYLRDRGSVPSARQFGRYLIEVHGVHRRDGTALSERHLRALLPVLRERFMVAV
ncbi:helix-turn-helix domain-containing protein [Streptomyces aculeolatus]